MWHRSGALRGGGGPLEALGVDGGAVDAEAVQHAPHEVGDELAPRRVLVGPFAPLPPTGNPMGGAVVARWGIIDHRPTGVRRPHGKGGRRPWRSQDISSMRHPSSAKMERNVAHRRSSAMRTYARGEGLRTGNTDANKQAEAFHAVSSVSRTRRSISGGGGTFSYTNGRSRQPCLPDSGPNIGCVHRRSAAPPAPRGWGLHPPGEHPHVECYEMGGRPVIKITGKCFGKKRRSSV